jgi:hypothetical protein
MDDVKKWLNGPASYDEGVKLLLKYCQDQNLRMLFTIQQESHYKRTRLRAFLTDLALKKTSPPKENRPKSSTGTIPTKQGTKWHLSSPHAPVAQNGWNDPSKMDDVERSLHERWKPLFSEYNHLRSAIWEIALAGEKDPVQKAAAGRMAHRIVDLADAIDDLYFQRDHFRHHGHLPSNIHPSPGETAVDPAIAYRKLKNAERYCRTFRGKLDKNPKDTASAAKLVKWTLVVDKYNKLLKID